MKNKLPMLRINDWIPYLRKQNNKFSFSFVKRFDLRLNESDICVGVVDADAPTICPNRLLSNKIDRLP